MHPEAREPITWTLVNAALLVAASTQLVPIASTPIRRVRGTRRRMYEAESGDLTVSAGARYTDELNFLERGFNRMLAQATPSLRGSGSIRGDPRRFRVNFTPRGFPRVRQAARRYGSSTGWLTDGRCLDEIGEKVRSRA